MPARNESIDLLRASAMFYIVCFYHLPDYIPFFPFKNSVTMLLTRCILGLFVFLSGFLLSKYKLSDKRDIFSFYWRRFIRIYPMYVATAFGFYVFNVIDISQFIKGLFVINVLTGSSPRTIWFVEMIFLFYLITPIFLFSFHWLKTALIGLILSQLLIISHFLIQESVDLRIGLYLLMYTCGIIAGRLPHILQLLSKHMFVFISFSLLPILWWIRTYTTDIIFVWVTQVAMLLFLPIAFFFAKCFQIAATLRIIHMASYASFAMYLIHRFTMEVAFLVYMPASILSAVLYLIFICFPITFFFAYIYQFSYDYACSMLLPNGKFRWTQWVTQPEDPVKL